MNHHTSTKVITQDRKDLDKFLKFLALKTVQVIVQSRLGEKIKTKSRANSATIDWFNIAIEDVLEVQNEAKKALNGQIPSVDFSLCIEISLKTVEGDTLVLETWNLCMNEQCDLSVSSTSVYNRMSLLLKSLIAVTRVTPAYKLSCRQGAESYVICYRTYQGKPRFHQLGEGYQENKIGEALTPLGTLTLSVAYRTKMTITPQKTEKESPFMLKSDYFKPDMSPKRSRPIGINGFHVEMNPVEEVTPVTDGLMNGISSSPVVNGHHCIHPCLLNHVTDGDRALWSSDKDGEARNNSINSQMSSGEPKKAGAFAPSTKVPDPSLFPDLLLPDTPFLNLLRSNSNNNPVEVRPPKQEQIRNADKNANLNVVVVDNKKTSENAGEVDYNCNANEGGCQKSACSDGSDCGDFVMVELRPPFADSDSNTDLGAFFRECQCAPPLVSFSSQPTLEEQVTDISCQLAMFETSMHDFDHFVDSICHVDAQQ